MTEYLQDAGYPGAIKIGDDQSPATYRLKASKENDGAFHVAVSLTAPRDWLLKHGFRNEATLVRQSGEETPVHFVETLDVADNISVTLTADDAVCRSLGELHRKFPELGAT